jgi:hypothetical protein
MWTQIFKIKRIEILLILFISMPMGYFIYARNVSKINYVFSIESGSLYLENFCIKYSQIDVPNILSSAQIGKMQNVLTSRINRGNPSYKTSIYINYGGGNAPYQIVIAGKDLDLELMTKEMQFIKETLFKEEIRSFSEKFSKIKIICQEKSYPLFKFFSPNNYLIEGSVNYAYSKNFLYSSALSPFLILYLLVIIYKLIRSDLKKIIS